MFQSSIPRAMEKLLKIIVWMMAVIVAEAVNDDDMRNHTRSKRMVGGKNVPVIHVPYQVSIELNGDPFCGGSIIAKHWIITTAHCIGSSKNSYKIRAGSSFTKKSGTLHTIREVIKHPNFTMSQHSPTDHDIALIHLDKSIKFDKFRQPIDLVNYNEKTRVGSIGFTSGYNTPKDQIFGNLQTVQLEVISNRECSALYDGEFIIPQSQFCAHSQKNGRGPCFGDSGSPFVIDKRLHGMVSWGIGCGLYKFPDVFIKIAPYRHWIDNIRAKKKK